MAINPTAFMNPAAGIGHDDSQRVLRESHPQGGEFGLAFSGKALPVFSSVFTRVSCSLLSVAIDFLFQQPRGAFE